MKSKEKTRLITEKEKTLSQLTESVRTLFPSTLPFDSPIDQSSRTKTH